jgi:predicted 3-demethylubiquinone-9 3-methyltransferase (glyoxalase superfamily)
MSQATIQKIVPFLWYSKDAEAAARFYTSVFPDSHIDYATPLPADSPSGPAGSVQVVEFTLLGQQFTAMSAQSDNSFNDAISFFVKCESQAEIDRYWNALLENGGKPLACGWLMDRYGVRWQIVPVRLLEMYRHPDKEKGKRVAEEMMRQVKFDIAKLEAVFAAP